MTTSETAAKCVKCSHIGQLDEQGRCRAPVQPCGDPYHGFPCGCKCEFSTSETAAPQWISNAAVSLCELARGISFTQAVTIIQLEYDRHAEIAPKTAAPSEVARKAAEKIAEWSKGEGRVDGQAINEVAAIIDAEIAAAVDTSSQGLVMVKLSFELKRYLDSITIDSNNIGDVRRSCFVPWDSPWNGLVRDETAAREIYAEAPEIAAAAKVVPCRKCGSTDFYATGYERTACTMCGLIVAAKVAVGKGECDHAWHIPANQQVNPAVKECPSCSTPTVAVEDKNPG